MSVHVEREADPGAPAGRRPGGDAGRGHRVEHGFGDPEPGGPGGERRVGAARLAAERDDGLHPRAAVDVPRREERAERHPARERGAAFPDEARPVEAEGDAPGVPRVEALARHLAHRDDRGPGGVGEGDVLVAPEQEPRGEGEAGVELGDGAVQRQRDGARRGAVVADGERGTRAGGPEVEARLRRDEQRAGPVREVPGPDEQRLAVGDGPARVERQARGRLAARLAADAEHRVSREVVEARQIRLGRDGDALLQREAEVVEHVAVVARVPGRARGGRDADERRRERPARREVRVEAEADDARGDARHQARLAVFAVPHEDRRGDEPLRPAVRRELARGEERGRVVDADRVDGPLREDRARVLLGRDLDVDGVPAGLEGDALRGALRARAKSEGAEQEGEEEDSSVHGLKGLTRTSRGRRRRRCRTGEDRRSRGRPAGSRCGKGR